MRGRQALYDSIRDDIFPSKRPTDSQSDRLASRNRKLATRYYYHVRLCYKSYEETLLSLEEEFNIGTRMIIQLLGDQTDYLKYLVQEKTTQKALSKEYPYFNWTVMRVS